MADNTHHEELNFWHVCSRRSSSDDSDKPVKSLSEVQDFFSFKPEPVDLSLTMDTLATKHQEFTKEWRASSTYGTCFEAIRATVLQQKKLNIDRCICLGLGTFTSTPYMLADDVKKTLYGDRRDRSFSQLVVFEGWIEQLSEFFLSMSTQNKADDLAEEKYPIANIYFQDPAFTPLDEAYLRSKGYSILHTPDSNTLINDATMLFTPREQPEVLEATLAVAFPGLYISHELSLRRDYHRPPGTSWVE